MAPLERSPQRAQALEARIAADVDGKFRLVAIDAAACSLAVSPAAPGVVADCSGAVGLAATPAADDDGGFAVGTLVAGIPAAGGMLFGTSDQPGGSDGGAL